MSLIELDVTNSEIKINTLFSDNLRRKLLY